MRNFLLTLSLSACAVQGDSPGAFVVQAVLDPGCVVAGAIPDDGLDDRQAIQLALDTQHCAYLPAGIYDIDTPSFTPPARRIYAMLTANGGEIFGDSADTKLHFRGSAGNQDWQGIRLTGENPKLHDLALDTSDITDTDEQTHAVNVLGPANAPTIYHVSFNHPQRGEPGGDCVQFVAYAPTPITNARVTWNKFNHCDRSGVAIHSGTSDLEISDNFFPDTGDQDIDGEGTGDNARWLIARNSFGTGPASQGAMAIQLQGTDTARVTNNTFASRGIFVYSSDNIEIDHNSMIRTVANPIAVIEIEKDSSTIQIHDNVIIRALVAGPGQIVRAAPHGSGIPDHVSISDNTLIQLTASDVVDTVGIVGLNIERNVIAASSNFVLQAIGSADSGTIPGTRTDALKIADNTITGAVQAVVMVSGSYRGAGSLSASGNTAVSAGAGVKCNNINSAGKILGPFTVVSNTWAPSVCPTLVVAPN